MATFNSRLRAARTGPQRPKIGGDENAVVSRYTKQSSVVGTTRIVGKTGPQRPALSEVTTNAVNKQPTKIPGKSLLQKGGEVIGKRARSSTIDGPQRVPLGPIRPTINAVAPTRVTAAPSAAPLRPQRPNIIRASETAPELHKPIAPVTHVIEPEIEDSMEVEDHEEAEVRDESDSENASEEEGDLEDEENLPQLWPTLTPRAAEKYRQEIDHIQKTFHDEIDMFDTTMVSEYADEIFEYMSKLEVDMMPNPDYIVGQTEITWEFRQTLIDWLLQVHLRYHLLPETLWIAINIVDRFLSKRIVSVVKLQLVGVTAMFAAAKYEEILAPSVEEFVYMTENGYSKEEILKGERIILQTLDFQVSSYCSPYSWMRRISKADDYDIQTRTLAKYLVEVTLLDHRFLRVKPSLVAAVGMYTARRMLGGEWNNAFVFYSGYTEEYLITGHNYIIEKLLEPNFEKLYVSRKYANKKFLKASMFAIEWARMNGPMPELDHDNDLMHHA